MGTRQVYRGNPVEKQYYVTNNFIGGINTLDVDEGMGDYEFRELINIDLATQGIIQSRKGFGNVSLFNTMLNHYNIELPTDSISYIKVLENTNNILNNIKNENYTTQNKVINSTITEFNSGDIQVDLSISDVLPESYETPYTYVRKAYYDYLINDWDDTKSYNRGAIVTHSGLFWVALNSNTGKEPGVTADWQQVYLPTTEQVYTDFDIYDGITPLGIGDLVIYDDKVYMSLVNPNLTTPASHPGNWKKVLNFNYYVNFPYYKFSGLLKILIINENHISLLKFDDIYLTYENLLVNSKELPATNLYKTTLTGAESVSYVGKIYISLNDISENYKGVLVYDRDTDTWTTWRGQYKLDGTWTDFDNDLSTDVYMPTPYDISSSSAGLTQGFNVMAESPLLYIDDQGTGLFSIRNIILSSDISFLGDTNFLDANYIDKVPTSGDFFISVIKTGNLSVAPESLIFIFKDEDGNILDFKIGSQVTNEYGVKYGGIFSYSITDLNTAGASYILVDVIYQNKVINKLDMSVASLESGDFNTLNNYYSVKNEQHVYKMTKSITTGKGGRLLSDYTKYSITARTEVSDLGTAVIGTLFASYKTSNNDGGYFQLTQGDLCDLYIYNHSTMTFNKQTNTDGILYDSFYDFIPMNGTLIDVGDASNYYLHYDISNSLELNSVSKTSINLSNIVPSLEGQYYDIGNDEPTEPITGLDLENIKMISVGNKMLYYKGNTIYFSKEYQFDYVPNFSFVILPLLLTDEIVKIKYFKGSYIIFTKNTIWKMKGTYGDADWQVQILNDSIGCIAPKSIISLENTLYFMTQNGLYRLAQNYYLDGLENVYKADKKIPDLIPKDKDIESILYRDQYISYLPDNYDYDVIRMYYNIDLPEKLHPFVKDLFAVRPNNLFMENGDLFSLKYGCLYLYDDGYTDFMVIDAVDNTDYLFKTVIRTSALNFGYPTHDKKVKNVYVKTKATSPTYLHFTIWLDGYLKAFPTSFRAVLDENEEIVYEEYVDYTKDTNINLTLDELGELELSTGVLGDNENATHKISLGYKGKTIQLQIEQQSDGNFGITNLGYLYKLGKVKEQR